MRSSKSGRVRLVLSGHYHGGYNLFEEEGVAFSTATAFCEFPHAYRTYDVDETGIAERVYTLADRMTRKPAILLDHDGLLDPLAESRAAIGALKRLSEAGYLLVGIIRQRLGTTQTVRELETGSDGLFDKLKDQGVEVNGLITRFAKEEDPNTLLAGCEHLLVSLAHSTLFTVLEDEEAAGREAGIGKVYRLDPTNSVEAFCEHARAICGAAS